VLALSATRAQAQSLPSIPNDKESRPWATGVSAREQAVAREIHRAGNEDFIESRFAHALVKYKEAIRHWDHPAIRFNMAVVLVNLDRPIEARDHLERSLVYGPLALGADSHREALTYRKLLDAQLVRLTIACEEPGATVTLDGKFVLSGPGSTEEVVLPGEHQVVTTKAGFGTASETFFLVAGKSYEIKPTVRSTAEFKALAAQDPCVDRPIRSPFQYNPTIRETTPSVQSSRSSIPLPMVSHPTQFTQSTQPISTIHRSPSTVTPSSQGIVPIGPGISNDDSTWAQLVKAAMEPTRPSQSATPATPESTLTSHAGAFDPSLPSSPTPLAPTPMLPTPMSPMSPTPMTHSPMPNTTMPHLPTPMPPMPHMPTPMPPTPMTHTPTTHMPTPHMPTPMTHLPTPMTHTPTPYTPTPHVPTPMTHTPTTHMPTPMNHSPTTHMPTPMNHSPTTHMPTPTTHMPTPTTHMPTPTTHMPTPMNHTPTYRPPTYQPPAPTYRPPTYQPPAPTYRPPTYQPPAPTYRPPTYQPPAPTYRPPTYQPPAPTYRPPTYQPPAPTYRPPTYQPPAPTYRPPTYQPPTYR
jgi:hypothetical protein